MPVLVSDTSVIIDLDRGALIEDLFRLPYQFAVPDLLYRRELEKQMGQRLITLGLRVENLSPDEVRRAAGLQRDRRQLSAPDTFAFAIAEARGWPLLAGDGGIRSLASDMRVECHGVLWVCDQFEGGQHVPVARLHAGLTRISTHRRCRLPAAEVRVRLERYALG